MADSGFAEVFLKKGSGSKKTMKFDGGLRLQFLRRKS